VVFAIAVLTGRRAVARAPPGVPGFLVGFVVQATLGLAGQLPDWLADAGFGLARALLLTAVAATGLRTEVRDFQTVGRSAMLLVAGETVFLARAAASLLTLCFPG
jgi:uncharacterized membrane protein YadS